MKKQIRQVPNVPPELSRIREMLIDPASKRPGANLDFKVMVDPVTGMRRFYQLDDDGNVAFIDNYSFN
jgi:hypothetical protein